VLTESAPDAWVNVNDDFRILKSGDRFLWTSWRDGYTHIYLYSFNASDPVASDAKLERQLESGDYEVLAVGGVDETSGTFSSPPTREIRERRRFFGKARRLGDTQHFTGRRQLFRQFRRKRKHFVETYSAPLKPRGFWCACRAVRVRESGRAQRGGLRTDCAEAPRIQSRRRHGVVWGFDSAAQCGCEPKDSLIVHIYGGAGAQTVQDAWGGTNTLFHQILANEGFAIFSWIIADSESRKEICGRDPQQFGGIELKDQLTALDQLYAQFPQLDRARTGIWGWSNGGSMTLYALTHSDRFKAGISVAPVTNWRDYDSIYTERWLGLPRTTPAAMTIPSSAPPGNLRGSLLLVHGTSDDNVHLQNTIQMTDALIRAQKQFRLMVYPNKTHGISGTGTRMQLFHMMEDFWNKELK